MRLELSSTATAACTAISEACWTGLRRWAGWMAIMLRRVRWVYPITGILDLLTIPRPYRSPQSVTRCIRPFTLARPKSEDCILPQGPGSGAGGGIPFGVVTRAHSLHGDGLSARGGRGQRYIDLSVHCEARRCIVIHPQPPFFAYGSRTRIPISPI
ncbi:hypothetical protein PENSPDRAFT_105043 [Peniophora sp. CONT]|nr:hypothetical protein PENSPDRAFT_105043 [Peniophora sp. CONT]